MVQNFLVVAGQVFTLFFMMAVGFLLSRKNLLTPVGISQMSNVLLFVASPCVILRALQTPCDSALLRELGVGTAVVGVLYVLYALLAVPLFRRQNVDTRATLQFSAVYGNLGFMGLPLVRAVLGEGALIFAMVPFVMFSLFSWTHGIVVMGGREAFSLKKLLLNPGVLSVTVALPLFLWGITLPPMVGNAVSFLADLNTPLAMIVIGGQMASANLPATFRNPRLYGSAAVKLLVLPALTAVLLLPLHLNPLMYCAAVLLAGTPSAGVTSIFSQLFQRDSATAAQAITLSTLLSVLTLPLCVVVAQVLVAL